MLSVLNVYFRDIQHFMGILFLVWFYLTPDHLSALLSCRRATRPCSSSTP